MSRSLGDRIAHSVGVSSHPEVKEFLIDIEDKFVVIASDGLWEFMDNEEVSRIVGPFYDQNLPESAANALVKAAHARWLEKEEVIDDITVVIVFLEPRMAYVVDYPDNYA
jgi:serine/threonine protein phosphatase PrpC